MGKMNVVDNLVDGLLYLVFLFHMLNYAEVQTGLAIKVRFFYELKNHIKPE